MNELLAIVGTSWRALLMYPGLLTGMVLTIITSLLWKRAASPTSWRLDAATVTHAACMFLMLAFLPVPGSSWRYGLDVIVALALVEVPHWFALRRRLIAPDVTIRAEAATETAMLLNVYVPLVLALAAIGQARGTMVLGEVRGGTTTLWWAGIVGWALALPPLLRLGPWRLEAVTQFTALLRRVAHIGLLVTLALPANADNYGLAVAALVAFGSLAVLDRWWQDRFERWERLQPLIALVLLLWLLYAGATDWYARMN